MPRRPITITAADAKKRAEDLAKGIEKK